MLALRGVFALRGVLAVGLLAPGAALAQQDAGAPASPPAADAPAEDPLASGQAADWRELYLHVRALGEAVGAPLLLMPVGEEARTATRKAAALMAPGQAELRTLPTVGDRQAEVALALQSEAHRCGAVVEARPGGLWFQPAGDCQPGAVEGPAAPVGPPLLAIGTRRGDPSWQVRDESGATVDAWRYAAWTGDETLRDQLLVERRRHRVGRGLLTAAGTSLLVGALVPLTASAVAGPEIAEDRRFTALFMGVTGATLVVGARLDRQGLEARQREVGRYVHADDAADVIADHNARTARRRAASAPPAPVPPAPPAPEGPATEPPAAEPPAAEQVAP